MAAGWRMDGLASILPEGSWERLAAAGIARSYAAGAVLMRQGDPTDHVVVLLRGRVKVASLDPDGNELVLAIRRAGEVLGEIGVIADDERSATVTAIEDCEARVIAASEFRTLVGELRLAEPLLRHVVRRLREGEKLRAELATLPAGRRVARALLRLSGWSESSGWPPDPRATGVELDQADLAQTVGLHRSTLAEELRRLRSRGIVRTERGRIVVTDCAGLLAASEG